MRKSIAESILNTVKNLNKNGLADNITIKNIEKLCNTDAREIPLPKNNSKTLSINEIQ